MATDRTLVMLTQLPHLPPRSEEAHKGTFGRVLVVAGSLGMAGAASLCGQAALRGGAGLVQVAVPADVLPVVASANPCYLTAALPQDRQGALSSKALDAVLPLVEASTVTVLGPGLGQGEGVGQVLKGVLKQTDQHLVLDADALNILARSTEHQSLLRARKDQTILTPHPGEFARLVGEEVATIQGSRHTFAGRYAGENGAIVILKGHRTVVSDGHYLYLNSTGNAGMATGGTGDVLAGLIAALWAQDLDAFGAAQLGVYLHGLAGDLARDELGEVSLIASDLLAYLPRAFLRHGPGAGHSPGDS